MFDVTSSKLLILGVVALLVIGPKDLPALLRTIGRYVAIIKRQAAEFRAQFEEAMRESELDQLKKEVETLGSTTEEHMRAAERSLEAELGTASGSLASPESVGATASGAAAEHTPEEQAAAGSLIASTAPAADPAPRAPADAPGDLGSQTPPAAGGDAVAGDAADTALRTPEKSGV